MTEIIFPWTGPTRKARGRNPFNADAVGFRHDPAGKEVRIHNRVASTGHTDHGWCAIPDDPALIRKLAAGLTALADQLDAS